MRVKASPERAFQAFVEEIGAWWRPSPLFETTPRPGRLSFEGGEGGLVDDGVPRAVESEPSGRSQVIVAVQAMNHAIATYWQVAAAQT